MLFVVNCVTKAQNFRQGAEFDQDKYEQQASVSLLASRDSSKLPAKVDLSGYCPIPGSQGKFGTCTSWATAYHARTILEGINQRELGAARANREAFSPSFIYNQIRKKSGCQNGTSIEDAMILLKTSGALKASVIKFNCSFNDWGRYDDIVRPHTIYDFLRLHDLYDNNKVQQVKKALAAKQPVVIGMHLTNSFQKIKSDGFYKPNSVDRGIEIDRAFFDADKYSGHAMTVVGYDDNKGRHGAFHVINSWGSKWGQRGFCWIEYVDFNRFVVQSFSMIDKPKYTADLRGSVILETSKIKTMNGVFDAKQKAYRLAKIYPKKTKFRIYLKNTSPIYLYAFGFDQTSKFFNVFPHKPSVSPYIPYENVHVPIPDEEHFIELDGNAGRNDLCVIFSVKPLPIEKILKDLKKRGKQIRDDKIPLYDAVSQVLKIHGHSVVAEKNTGFKFNKFEFNSKRLDETCVPLIIKFAN